MNTRTIPTLTMLALTLSLGASSLALASADTSPKPGGVYRLKPGIYVANGSDCAAPANAAIRQYDGKGLSTAHTRACKATVRSQQRGGSYTVDQSCIDAGAGPAPRVVQRQQIVVRDALHFTQVIKGDRTSYQYCPVYQLPVDLQKAVR
ncbi:hypothetical protein [Janthinobacterium psychrotolerans]|uniref:Secreted protein n=1 Tax=Janthinobacterium psychrotolerans TaxID=1747903 RepID=A0A1A7C4G7_9BURK|nr:hypothetical protein [Janthinobacterium psychrotolerans]OBV39635.1 hypothetical protein ASR47_101124 [Janthinobacterium psychrotolerans]